MKNYKNLIAIIVSMAVLTGTVTSCAVSKKKVPLSSDETISAAVDPVSLKELPRGEYEVYEADYLKGIENISNITPLNNNRFLISSDTSGYGDAASQKLYIADDEKSTVTEITPELGLDKTAYYSALGTTTGEIFITAIEPKYTLGKDPGHASEENSEQDHLDYLFSKAKNVEYKLFELNTKGEIISENTVDIEYDKEAPVTWLLCDDCWDNELVITAVTVKDYESTSSSYIVDKQGKIKGQIENYIPYYGPSVRKVTSDDKLCFVGGDYTSEEPQDALYFYSRNDNGYSLFDNTSVKIENFGCETRSGSIEKGTFGHGNDLLYLCSGIGLFAFDKDRNYENVINYIDMIPATEEIRSVVVLDNNSVLVLGKIFDDEYKNVLYKFKSVNE
ncbi:hypothetical protein [Ruminococcus flavefaciens]|uniref:hypothetical protein n=1 Tax=Ruminococcus flavefaciens TaxID=1265 RepID=UPI00048D005E|nr:hypothetical protein [Ruminococcus flavefaciens]